MTPEEYKAEKIASVSHLDGGGIWEINYVTLIAPAAAFLWALLQTRQSFFKPYTLPAAVTDFLLHCCGILYATTVYAGAPQMLLGLLFLPAIATVLQPATESKSSAKTAISSESNGKLKKNDDSAAVDLDPLPVKPFITTYRGAMMIVTCTSILAVDFRAFPRRFAKTESFGTSLMDLGVGSFVFAAGIVAARAQLKEQFGQPASVINRLKTALRHSAPLAILGLIRLLSVKGLDYAEHVSEYGVHWNFFFTLALLPPAVAILQPVLRIIPSHCALAFIIAGLYEMALYFIPDMKYYIILSERVPGDFLSQNREGIFSFIGYLAIFIAGIGIGLGILPRDPESDEPNKKEVKDVLDEDSEWLASVMGQPQPQQTKAPAPQPEGLVDMLGLPRTFMFLARWTGIWLVLAVWAMWRYGPQLFVSRRMANLSYVVWVCTFNCAQLLLFCGIENLMFPNLYTAKDRAIEKQRIRDATSRVMKAFNRNGLALFLLANLLTGAVNMAIPTLHMSDVGAMVVLTTYIATICGVGITLDAYSVSIKL